MVKNKENIKESWMDILKYLAKKKTIAFLIFILFFYIFVRADFSCEWKNWKEFNFKFGVKNINDRIPKR